MCFCGTPAAATNSCRTKSVRCSPHTNAPTRDIDREPRAMIGPSGLYKIDIGADEFTGVAQINRELATQPAD